MNKIIFAVAILILSAQPVMAENKYVAIVNNSQSTVSRSTDDQTLLDYTGTTSGVPIYVGHAQHGVASSASDWRVCKTTDSAAGPTAIKCTDGIWDNRASLSYS